MALVLYPGHTRPSSSGQDGALSRRKQGFDSPWAYQTSPLFTASPASSSATTLPLNAGGNAARRGKMSCVATQVLSFLAGDLHYALHEHQNAARSRQKPAVCLHPGGTARESWDRDRHGDPRRRLLPCRVAHTASLGILSICDREEGVRRLSGYFCRGCFRFCPAVTNEPARAPRTPSRSARAAFLTSSCIASSSSSSWWLVA
jgi:hypothetical protein